MKENIFNTRSILENQINSLSALDIRRFSKQLLSSKVDIRKISISQSDFLGDHEHLIEFWISAYEIMHSQESLETIEITTQDIELVFSEVNNYFKQKFSQLDKLFEEVLGVENNLCQYLIGYLEEDKAGCSKAILELLGLLYSVSLKQDLDKVAAIIQNIPHYGEGDDLNCLRGTINRIIDINIEENCGEYLVEFYKALKSVIVTGYKITDPLSQEEVFVEGYTQNVSKYIDEVYHIHIPSFLHYILAIDNENDRDLYVKSMIASLDLIGFSYNFPRQMREVMIMNLQEMSNMDFMLRFDYYLKKNVKYGQKEIINLDEKNLLSISNAQNISKYIQDEERFNDFIVALDFISVGLFGREYIDRRMFLQLFEIMANIVGKEFDLSEENVQEVQKSFVDMLLGKVKSKDNFTFLSHYQERMEYFSKGILEQYRRFVVDIRRFSSNSNIDISNWKNINFTLLLNHGISIKKLAEILKERVNIVEDIYIVSRENEYMNAAFVAMIHRDDFRKIHDKIAENKMDPRNNNDTEIVESYFKYIISIIVQYRRDNIDGQRLDDILSIFENVDRKIAILQGLLEHNANIRDSYGFAKIFETLELQESVVDKINYDVVKAIVESDFAEALEVVYQDDIKKIRSILIDEKSMLYFAVLNNKFEISNFIIEKSILAEYSLSQIFIDGETNLADILVAENRGKIIEHIFKVGVKNGHKVEDINNIASDGLLSGAIASGNFSVVNQIYNAIEQEIINAEKSLLTRQFLLRDINVIKIGSQVPLYEQKVESLQSHYEKYSDVISNIDFLEKMILHEAFDDKDSEIDRGKKVLIALKCLRLCLLNKNYKQIVEEKIKSSNKDEYKLFISSLLLIASGMEEELYEMLHIFSPEVQCKLLFQKLEDQATDLFEATVFSSKVQELFQALFLPKKFSNALMRSLPDDKNYQGNIIHLIVSGRLESYTQKYSNITREENSDKTLYYIDKVRIDLSEFNVEDFNGKTPFELYIDRIFAVNDQGEQNIAGNELDLLEDISCLASRGITIRVENDDNIKKSLSILKKIINMHCNMSEDYKQDLGGEFSECYANIVIAINKLDLCRFVDVVMKDKSIKQYYKDTIIHHELSNIGVVIDNRFDDESMQWDEFFSNIVPLFSYMTCEIIGKIMLLDDQYNAGFDFLYKQFSNDNRLLEQADHCGVYLLDHLIECTNDLGIDFLLNNNFLEIDLLLKKLDELSNQKSKDFVKKLCVNSLIDGFKEYFVDDDVLNDKLITSAFEDLDETIKKVYNQEILELISIAVEEFKEKIFANKLQEEIDKYEKEYNRCLEIFNADIKTNINKREFEEISENVQEEESEEESEEENQQISIKKRRKNEDSNKDKENLRNSLSSSSGHPLFDKRKENEK